MSRPIQSALLQLTQRSVLLRIPEDRLDEFAHDLADLVAGVTRGAGVDHTEAQSAVDKRRPGATQTRAGREELARLRRQVRQLPM